MAGEGERPVGELFSRAYGERGDPAEDSPVFRRRLGAYIQGNLREHHGKLESYLKVERGMRVS